MVYEPIVRRSARWGPGSCPRTNELAPVGRVSMASTPDRRAGFDLRWLLFSDALVLVMSGELTKQCQLRRASTSQAAESYSTPRSVW
jgi:hypothetical protein